MSEQTTDDPDDPLHKRHKIWWYAGVAVVRGPLLIIAALYLYWALAMISWTLGYCNWPETNGYWTFLAYASAAVYGLDRAFQPLKD